MAILVQTCGRIGAIKALLGEVEMAFAIGILILVIAATTIIGATVLSFMVAADRYDPVDARAKARDRRASPHRDAADRLRARHQYSTARAASANQRDGVEAPERIGSRNWEQSQEIARLRAKLVQ